MKLRILFQKIFHPVKILLKFLIHDLFPYLLKQIRQSIRIQLILVIGISIVVALAITNISGDVLERPYRQGYIDYHAGREQIENEARIIVQHIQSKEFSLNENTAPSAASSDVPLTPQDISKLLADSKVNPLQNLEHFLNQEAQAFNIKILFVTYDGGVLLKSGNASEVQVNIQKIIETVLNSRMNQENERGKEFYSFYPLNANRLKGYVIVSGIPQAQIAYYNVSNSKQVRMAEIALFISIFVFIYLLLTRGKMRYLEHLAQGLLEISKGNLDYRVMQKYEDELGSLARNVNHMAEELQQKIEQERQAERTKNELITNVSHDLRTPLTSIMGYLRLLLDHKYDSPEQAESFLTIAFGKSEKLKSLIEDLFEYTKLTNENITLNQERISLDELLEQLVDELVPISEEKGIQFKTDFPTERIWISMDADKMIRVYENLIMNAIKYSHKPGEVIVRLWVKDEYVITGVYNSGEGIPSEDLPFLFERFYRVEKSRTSSRGGSGLGLAIAKQIVELHGGTIWAESEGEEVRFFVKIPRDKSINQ